MNRRPTVVEVADRAGVSIASVSRVLNGKPARPDTEDRVRAAVAELGYVPDATGRALKLGATMQVAFAVDDVGNPVYTEMMRGVEEGMAGSGARLLVAVDRARPHRPRRPGPQPLPRVRGRPHHQPAASLARAGRRPRQRAGPRGGRG